MGECCRTSGSRRRVVSSKSMRSTITTMTSGPVVVISRGMSRERSSNSVSRDPRVNSLSRRTNVPPRIERSAVAFRSTKPPIWLTGSGMPICAPLHYRTPQTVPRSADWRIDTAIYLPYDWGMTIEGHHVYRRRQNVDSEEQIHRHSQKVHQRRADDVAVRNNRQRCRPVLFSELQQPDHRALLPFEHQLAIRRPRHTACRIEALPCGINGEFAEGAKRPVTY